ncbi:MAG: UDP-N-acetylmuramoyl-tripeptide--D-alanyl-D-alanine ligase [Geobacteraceae bacterium]|nr:UDP-N-acetylmuramoyl-tripeptide--D-alanyl-D-alanine ligase [Geobacteraceae bacterium]
MFTVDEIARATGGMVRGSESVATVFGVSTDSRTALPGELFVPLKGDRFDGHDYLGALFDKGIKVVLAAEDHIPTLTLPADVTVIAVADTLKALGDLANFHRNRFNIPIIGITGSNGKTTTKEMLASILKSSGEGLKTSGNLNNLIGLPQMVFQLNERHKWAVLEMGMSEFGEIDRLAEIAAPSIGIITNAYPAHLANLGSVEGVAKAKGELFLRLKADDTAIFNADDPFISLAATPDGVKRREFGLHGADVTALNISACGNDGQKLTLKIGESSADLLLQAFGTHNIYNALAAAAAADSLGLSIEAIAAGLAAFTPYDKRFNLTELGPIVLIDDSYNSNPASTGAALLTIRELKGGNRAIAVLGDMLELGDESDSAHRDVGHLAATCVERLYLYGAMGEVVAQAALEGGMPEEEVIHASTYDEIVQDIVKDHLDGDYILVKGSRGMRMDLLSGALREIFSGSDYTGGRG